MEIAIDCVDNRSVCCICEIYDVANFCAEFLLHIYIWHGVLVIYCFRIEFPKIYYHTFLSIALFVNAVTPIGYGYNLQ